MVGVNIGDHRHHRREMQERSVTLVGFRDQILTAAQFGVGVRALDLAADHERRIQPAGRQHRRDQAGGGGLAVRAGDGDAIAETHQLRQHFRASHHRHAPLACGAHLGVVLLDRRGHHDHIGLRQVRGGMTFFYGRTQFRQARRSGAGFEIGAAHRVAQIQQYLGDAGHAGAANADEMHGAHTPHGLIHQSAYGAGLNHALSPAAPHRQ